MPSVRSRSNSLISGEVVTAVRQAVLLKATARCPSLIPLSYVGQRLRLASGSFSSRSFSSFSRVLPGRTKIYAGRDFATRGSLVHSVCADTIVPLEATKGPGQTGT